MTIEELYNQKLYSRDSNIYKKYEKLKEFEVDLLIDTVIANASEDGNINIDVLLHLAMFSYNCGEYLPQKLYDYLITNNIFYYPEIYIRANEDIAEKIINLFHSKDVVNLNANHALSALAYIPCEKVKDFFTESSQEPLPNWAKKLYITPIQYGVYVGGWSVDINGEIKKLYSDNTQAFIGDTNAKPSGKAPMKLVDEKCGFCGRRLVLCFDDAYKLATCSHCSSYQTIFTKQDSNDVYWHSGNKLDGYLKSQTELLISCNDDENNEADNETMSLFAINLSLSDEQRRFSYTAHDLPIITRTQIGGMATSINDLHYPACPDCGEVMCFEAQLDTADVNEYAEGIYYFYVCHKCNTIACNYDQS